MNTLKSLKPLQLGKLLGLIAIVAIATFALSCGQRSSNGSNPPRTLKILLDWKAEPTYAGFFIAREKGYFDELKEQGFNIEIVEGSGATTAAQVMGSSDNYVVASCSGEATAIAVSKGIPVRSLAVLYPNVPTVIYSRKDTPIREPKDMIGKRIGLIDGSITVDEYRGVVNANGIDRSKIEEIHVGWDVAPLLTKKVDGLMNYEELTPVELKLQGHEVVVMRFADHGLKAYSLNLITNPRTLARDRDKIEKIVAGVIKGYEFIKDNPEEAAQIFSRLYPEKNKDYVRESMKIVARAVGDGPVGQQTPAGWNDTIKTLSQLGLIQTNVVLSDVVAEGFMTK